MPKSKANSSNVSTGPVSSIDPDDAPELTDQLLEYIAETAEYRHGDTVIARGRPPLGTFFKKATVTIRLDPDVVEAYRALGTGWQTRINDDLRKARKLGSKRRPA